MFLRRFLLSLFFLLGTILGPHLALAAPTSTPEKIETFKARVVEVLRSEIKEHEDGGHYEQQDLRLLALSGSRQGQEIIYHGISEIEVASANVYRVGDEVFVDSSKNETGQEDFYVVDFSRSKYLLILAIIFVLAVLVVGRFKGLKALLGLGVSFVIILKFILPQIIAGHDPFLISLVGGVGILAVIIYLTEGLKRKSHLAILAVLISLAITLALSIIFSKLTRLTGLSQEEAVFLIDIGGTQINFFGLLLAGMIIGAIGVLDDIIIGQIEAVEQIKVANPNLSTRQIFSLAYKIGNTHLGAIINTLFLTYTGAALPLLLLFVINQEAGLTLTRLVNTEVVSTEIVRTLVGSIGVIISMPIATFLAALKLPRR